MCAKGVPRIRVDTVSGYLRKLQVLEEKTLIPAMLIEPKVRDCSFRLHTTLPFPTHLGPLDLYLVITR